jgi:FKBP-type peptidyl-prolyl cis-trans isomerase
MSETYKAICFLGALVALAGLQAAAAEIKSADDLKDARQRASYGLGVQASKAWKGQGADLDWDAYFRGVLDAQAEGELLLTDQQIREAMDAFRTEVQGRQQAKLREEGASNRAAGEAFLADNKTKEGVQTTASGLQYKVVQMGNGPKPKATDRVTVHYTGTLIDGKKFDSSVDRGQPATFPLSGVIKGWTEGLQLMPTGSKFKFFIPPDLAYGQRAPSTIGPDQVLVFDVELLEIESPKAAQPVTSDIIKVPSKEELEKGAQIEVIKAEDVPKLIEQERAKQEQQKKEQPPK